ncbi:hypothetical protein J8273_3421 [Carpediemonas membranifera]|uniref:Uncharacterized protein n=1 Tax=Carpediemonas membranifera TaxID=201153 RepID=A0A8J6B0Z9_9EUKA|nr:hypothetical protein J8273_3421 [Carpediemonas membranifera]|eukprot:KAG9393288.1 hypothetical protein J8273_3421 [Carpediemonas membranifera]
MSRDTKLSPQALGVAVDDIATVEAQVSHLIERTKDRLACIFSHVDKYDPPTQLPPENGAPQHDGELLTPQKTCICGMTAPNPQNWQNSDLSDHDLVVSTLRSAISIVNRISDESTPTPQPYSSPYRAKETFEVE